MKINTAVELPTGAVEFSGELTPEETKLVVEIGFNFLVRSGSFNVIDKLASTHTLPETEQ